MCASRTGKVAVVGLFLSVFVGVPYVVDSYPWLVPEWLPSWAFLAVLAASLPVGGLLVKALDLWRWHLVATSLGLQRVGSDAAADGSDPITAYRGEFEGRHVTLDHTGTQADAASSWTRVEAAHGTDVAARVVVHERGVGGVPESALPPELDIGDGALADRFHVYCENAESARGIFTGHVRELLVETDDVDQLEVNDDTVVSKRQLQTFDADVIRRHMRVATTVAEAVESASHDVKPE